MLRIIRHGQRWLTALFVVGVGGVFIFFLGLGGPLQGPSGGTLIEVGEYRFGIRDFERERQYRTNQYQDALGESFDAEALSGTLDDLTARGMVEKAILAIEAKDLGLRVAKQEIERVILNAPIFRGADGRFDQQAFEDWAEYEYGNQRLFMRDHRLAMLSNKMLRLLNEQAGVSEGEARESLRQRLQEVRIAFSVLDTKTPPPGAEISEEAVAAFFPTRDEEARILYGERSEQYDVPEQVRARHILFRLESDADDAAIEAQRAAAAAALEELRSGADFAVLAEELSDDPGSKSAGGDLGFFRRGQMVKAFEDAAFSLEPGALSEVVRSDYGFHVIRAEERREARHRAYEDVREELAQEILGAELGRAAARELADRLSAGVREGRSLEEVAREGELTLERSGWLKRRPDGYVPGLGAAQELLVTAFAIPVGSSSSRVFEVDDKLALVQVLERKDPAAEEIEAGIEAERKRLSRARRDRLADTWVSSRRTALSESGDLRVDLQSIRGS